MYCNFRSGATNLVTGIATAYMDSVPMVAITGNVAVDKLGKDSFQEVDIQGITMPITKHNYMVKDINQLADVLREAFYLAKAGRPGPVLVDIPKNLTSEETEYTPQKPKQIVKIKGKITDDILELINNAKKPMIYAGGGVVRSHANQELLELVEKLNAPIATSLMAVGSVPRDHTQYTGMVGMHGSLVSNTCFSECDLLLCIGARFSDRVIGDEKRFADHAKIVQFDIDPAEVNKNILVDAYVLGDIKETLKELNDKIDPQSHDEWLKEVNELKETHQFQYDTQKLNVPLLIKKIGEYAKPNAIIGTDVGQHQMWTGQHYPFTKESNFLTSGGLGTMGYGMGSVMGANFANRDRQTILVTGDGSFRMNFNEIVTAVRNGLAIKVFLMNNQTLGMVRQWQNLFYEERYAATDLSDDIEYELFAKSLGAEGYTIKSIDEIDTVIPKALNSDKFAIINCIVHINDRVYPMVPPGKAIHEAISE